MEPEEEERREGFTAKELTALIAEAEAEPAVRTTPEEFGRWMDGVIDEAVASR